MGCLEILLAIATRYFVKTCCPLFQVLSQNALRRPLSVGDCPLGFRQNHKTCCLKTLINRSFDYRQWYVHGFAISCFFLCHVCWSVEILHHHPVATKQQLSTSNYQHLWQPATCIASKFHHNCRLNQRLSTPKIHSLRVFAQPVTNQGLCDKLWPGTEPSAQIVGHLDQLVGEKWRLATSCDGLVGSGVLVDRC